LPEDGPVMKHAKRAVESLGPEPIPLFSNGGLDVNWFDKHGVPMVTIGSGQYEIHMVIEYVDLPEFANGCRLAVALATLEMYRRE
jgi:tripeptide aminopeptidase